MYLPLSVPELRLDLLGQGLIAYAPSLDEEFVVRYRSVQPVVLGQPSSNVMEYGRSLDDRLYSRPTILGFKEMECNASKLVNVVKNFELLDSAERSHGSPPGFKAKNNVPLDPCCKAVQALLRCLSTSCLL